jgi:nicotinic acetylcholine receptor
VLGLLLFLLPADLVSGGNPDAKRLYDDLLSNYNKLVRPVVNVTEAVTVRLKLKLSQLIDVVSQSDEILFRQQNINC